MKYLVYQNGIGSHPWWVVDREFLAWVQEHGFWQKPEEALVRAYCDSERGALLLRNALDAEDVS